MSLHTDFARELMFKMSMAFDLPVDNRRVQVNEIKQLRPFKEIEPAKMSKRKPYEEFWLTDFEIENYNAVGRRKDDSFKIPSK